MENRRGFLGQLFKGVITAAVAPQVVTHGLKLVRKENLYLPVYDDVQLYNKLPFYLAQIQSKHWTEQMYKVYQELWPKLPKENLPDVHRKIVYDLPEYPIEPSHSSFD